MQPQGRFQVVSSGCKGVLPIVKVGGSRLEDLGGKNVMKGT